MGFWIFLFLMNMLIPVTMIGFGTYFTKQAPKDINTLFGYRTAMSIKNRKTWEYAHCVCGKLWTKLGFILLGCSAAAMLPLLGNDIDTVGYLGGGITLLQVLALVLSIIPVEKALKKKFDRNGLER